MNQIIADGVAPVHRTTLPAEGIVLIKQMKLALKLNQTMGIIHPTHRWLKMVVFSPWMRQFRLCVEQHALLHVESFLGVASCRNSKHYH